MSEFIIFHHPRPVEPGGRSGSQVRPYRMLQALRTLGPDVQAVTGGVRQRIESMQEVRRRLASGDVARYVYSESSTQPTLLTEPDHIPRWPIADFRFLNVLRDLGAPVGLYYRDVYWRFDLYRQQVSLRKRLITVPLYRLDWWAYRRLIDHLFLPSLAMHKHLPGKWPMQHISALPAGCDLDHLSARPPETVPVRPLQLLYVGGVTPPLYDLRTTVAQFGDRTDVCLTLCCRQDEWSQVGKGYGSLGGRVQIVHQGGAGLIELYGAADIALMPPVRSPYREFAMPVKLFEAIGAGVPVIAAAGTEAGRFVEAERLGWVVDGADGVASLASHLAANRQEVSEATARVRAGRERHSWRARAAEVDRILSANQR